MTWTWGNDPANSERDEVRSLTGDTDTNDQLLTDEQIAFALTECATPTSAAAYCCRQIAAKLARRVDERVGEVSIKFSDQAKYYLELAKTLDRKARLGLGRAYSAGISRDEKESYESDSDRVEPAFTRDLFDGENGSDPSKLYDYPN